MHHLLSRQWERLAEIQEIQVELLADLSRALPGLNCHPS